MCSTVDQTLLIKRSNMPAKKLSFNAQEPVPLHRIHYQQGRHEIREKKIVLEHGVCRPIKEEIVYSGKTIELTKFNFKDPQGTDRVCEGIQKVDKTTNGHKRPENLCTIAVLRRQIMCDCLVLVKQYRAPMKSYTLEFPATVMNDTETIEDTASKELEDETGYSATIIKHISPLTTLDADVSDGTIKIVDVLIDGDDPLQCTHPRNNQVDNGNGKGGHGAIVEVIHVPINGLLDRLNEYYNNGIIIDSRVYAFAIGLKKGERLARAACAPETPI